MAEGDGQRVGSVPRFRRQGQAELYAHELLHLRLPAPAVPGHSKLYLRRRVLAYRQTSLRRRQQRDSTRLADGKRGADVLGDERFLNRHLRRPPAVDDVAEPAIYLVQAFLSWALATPYEGARGEGTQLTPLRADDAPAGHSKAGVDSQHYEAIRCWRWRTSLLHGCACRTRSG